MAVTVTDILNQWNQIGVFSYVIPFLLIFAVIFAILQKTKILTGEHENKGLLAIISIAVSLLALQFDMVSIFFAVIFPRFGIGLSIFLVLLILLGFFYDGTDKKKGMNGLQWIGILTGVGVVIWALAGWDDWVNFGGFSWWIQEYFWSLVVLAGLIGIIYWVINGGKNNPGGGATS